MVKAQHGRSIRLTVSALVAVSLMVILTAAASADSNTAKWSGSGQVIYTGPSIDPSTPTTTESEFKLRRDGTVRAVQIHTTNELFAGVLGDGVGGSAITQCKDRRNSNACERLDELLTGSMVTSLHNSAVRLNRITHGEIQVPAPTPAGEVVLNVPTLSGNIRGKIEGHFALSNDTGIAIGTSELRIRNGSTATYACFTQTPAGPVPLESLQPCIDHAGGMLFPVVLDVHDRGKFELGHATGSLEEIVSIEGRVEVHAQANLLLNQFGGKIVIPRAKATLTAEETAGD